MDFVNNWSRPITLAAGATTLALDLPDGSYRLTLADKSAGATRWEIIDASVAAGTATLTRAQEGTTDQAWPDGSVIYCGLTAGTLAQLAAPAAPVRSPVIEVSADRSLTSADDGAYLLLAAAWVTLTIAEQAAGAWADGAELRVQTRVGTSIAPGAGVSLSRADGVSGAVSGAHSDSVITLKRVGLNWWMASGDVSLV